MIKKYCRRKEIFKRTFQARFRLECDFCYLFAYIARSLNEDDTISSSTISIVIYIKMIVVDDDVNRVFLLELLTL